MTAQPSPTITQPMASSPKPRACCAHCGEPIKGPLWKRYCSDACKMRAYRLRKARKAAEAQPEEAVTNGT